MRNFVCKKHGLGVDHLYAQEKIRFEVWFVERSEAPNWKGQEPYPAINAMLVASRYTDSWDKVGKEGRYARQGEEWALQGGPVNTWDREILLEPTGAEGSGWRWISFLLLF